MVLLMNKDGHRFRVLEEKDVEIRGEKGRDQAEYCVSCGMRLSYFNKGGGKCQ